MIQFGRTFHGVAVRCNALDVLSWLSSGRKNSMRVSRGTLGSFKVGKHSAFHHLEWKSDVQYSNSMQFVESQKGTTFTYDIWAIVFDGPRTQFTMIAVPFRKMLSGFFKEFAKEMAGKDPVYFRIGLKDVIDTVREQGRIKKDMTVDGLDFYVFGEERSKEVMLLGDDPVNSSLYSVILEHLTGVTLAPSLIGITVGSDSIAQDGPYTVTTTYNGFYSFMIHEDAVRMGPLDDILATLDRGKFIVSDADRPVLRSKEDARARLLTHYQG